MSGEIPVPDGGGPVTSWTRYWVSHLEDGTVSHLVRIRKVPGEGLWTEYFFKGQWHEDPAVYSYLMDPLRGDEISPEEAERLVREFGYDWPGEPAPPPPG